MSLYIDISHLLNWSGRMSGIERVEFNIVSHFINTESQFIFWSEASGSFELYKKTKVQELIETISKKQQSDGVNVSTKKLGLFTKIKTKIINQKKEESKKAGYNFQKGDRVLILDGLWDKQSYVESLKSISKDVQIDHIVYDMIPVLFPGYVLDFITTVFEDYMKVVLPLCTNIYAISKNTAEDTVRVLERWGCKNIPKISSFQLGDDILTEETYSGDIPEGNYIIATGTIEVRKNYPLLLYVYGLARERNLDLPPTLIVGKRGWLSENFQHIVDNDPYYNQKIKILGNVSDGHLSSLYESALLAVCTSYYEGWGLPVRESLSYGKVTLSSNTSSLIEAGGNYADYFSPHEPEALLTLILKYTNRDVLLKRESDIRKNYLQCSWSDAMKKFDTKVSTNS